MLIIVKAAFFDGGKPIEPATKPIEVSAAMGAELIHAGKAIAAPEPKTKPKGE